MGGLISGITGSAKKARKAQTRAAEHANNDLGAARDENIARLQPQIDYGNEAITDLMTRLGIGDDSSNPLFGDLLKNFTGDDLASTPGYQFGLDQGMQALNRSAGAKGNLLSGASLKAAERFGQDYAGTKFQEGYNRDLTDKQRVAQFLGNASTMGVNAIDKANDTRFNQSLQYGATTIGAGNALAAQHTAQGNIWDGVLNQGIQELRWPAWERSADYLD